MNLCLTILFVENECGNVLRYLPTSALFTKDEPLTKFTPHENYTSIFISKRKELLPNRCLPKSQEMAFEFFIY